MEGQELRARALRGLRLCSARRLVGFCRLVCETSAFMCSLSHVVFYNLEAAAEWSMIRIAHVNSLQAELVRNFYEKLIAAFLFFPNVLQSFASTLRTLKLLWRRTCEKAVAGASAASLGGGEEVSAYGCTNTTSVGRLQLSRVLICETSLW